MSGVPSALHVNDCAFTAERLLAVARSRGWRWRFQPVAARGRTWNGPVATAQKAALGAAWLARLGVRASTVDLLHVHSGSVLRHSRLVPKRYVLHLHGTDIRTLQYQPSWQAVIRDGVRDALAVLYSTPDLAEHVLPLRPDARYLPVPITVDELPLWVPRTDRRPVVVFASRWDASKGAVQLELARALVRALDGQADVVGLDWGETTAEAVAAGVRLEPRRDHEGYLRLLAEADVVVGQGGGILAASELEALGTGAPLVLPVDLPLYVDLAPPVAGGSVDGAVDAVRSLLQGGPDDGAAARRDWVRRHHSSADRADTVAEVYRDALRA